LKIAKRHLPIPDLALPAIVYPEHPPEPFKRQFCAS
jgi:hypothetical protein